MKSKKDVSSTDEDDSETVSCEENYYYSENFDEDDDDKPEGGNTGNAGNSADRDPDSKDIDSVKEQGEESDKNTETQNETEQGKDTESTCKGANEGADDSVQIGTASIEYDGDQESTTEGESSFSKQYRQVEDEEDRPLRQVIQATKIDVKKTSNISLTIEQVGLTDEEVDVTVDEVTLQPTIIANYASSSAETIDPSEKGTNDIIQSQNTDDGSLAEDAQDQSLEELEAIHGSNAPFAYDERFRSHILLSEYTNSEQFSEEGKLFIYSH